MEAMKKEIARLNNIIACGCMDDESKKPKFIQGRHPFIKDGLGRIDMVTLREARPARGTW
jgi:hypothetical protein